MINKAAIITIFLRIYWPKSVNAYGGVSNEELVNTNKGVNVNSIWTRAIITEVRLKILKTNNIPIPISQTANIKYPIFTGSKLKVRNWIVSFAIDSAGLKSGINLRAPNQI